MAQQIIDTTTPQPNGKIGDTAKVAFGKVNDNFTELYNGKLDTAATATAATKLATPRTLTIGNTGKSFDGSANVSWSLDEIGVTAFGLGAAAASVPGNNIDDNTIPTGFYYVTATTSGAKPPGYDGAGHLIVSREGNGVTSRQLYLDNTTNRIWTRTWAPSQWTSWVELYHSGNAGALSFRNKLINAAFTINQRGYASGAATTAANQYTLDRWRVVTSGENLSWSGTDPNITITAPAGGVEQVIEGIWIEGGTYTLSWTGTATATVNGSAVANGGQVTLTAGANATVRFSGGTVSKPQLEPGSYATPFEHRPIGVEYELCRRYTRVLSGLGVLSGATQGTSGEFPVSIDGMRAIPSMLAGIGGQDFIYRYGAGGVPVTGRSIWQSSTRHLLLRFETGVELGVWPAVVDINTPMILSSEL